MLKLTSPDGKIIEIQPKCTGLQVAEKIGPRLAQAALGIMVDGEVRDLMRPIEKGAAIRILTFKDKEGKDILRHSTAHIFAHAIKRLYPKAKPTIGPAVEEGFYYDFDELKITPEDFPKIEEEMGKIVKANYPFERHDWKLADVKKHEGNNPYKVEMASEYVKKGLPLTAYKDGDFIDLCEGPHVPATGYVKAFKLLKIAGAYWHADAKNKQLIRIYGISFPSDKELKEYLALQEEMEKRDHRKIGKELDLFTFSELVGSGLPLFTPRGTIMRDELVALSEGLQKKHGFQKVWIPHITKIDLYKKSGHWDKFGHELFLVKSQETSDQFALKPMNCPHHSRIYCSQARSYRELPIRYYETTTIYRDEKTGELGGLSRVRAVTQDDGHIFCRPDQIEDEFENIMSMIKQFYGALNMTFTCRLSFRDPKQSEKYLGDAKSWENAQAILGKVAKKLKLDHFVAEGEAAFYGPKIDIMVTDALGRQWQCATEQLDFVQPVRLGLTYVGADGKEKVPFMIHKALLGSVERFLSVYIEHTTGKFPLWVSPEQVRVLTVSEKFSEGAQKLVHRLNAQGIRAHLDGSMETINKKVRNAQLMQVNYILVFGEKELNGALQVRTRDNKVFPSTVEKFIADLKKEIENRT
ncbi:threonine--tRNA ligase [Candidatus Woesearchaeota archaeon]|nr:threonine--tRNA ligase [Candidatus Woesearchaeota archaeon]